MNERQRAAVRSNALYLRQVRPIDPDEIHEYVEGAPHPAAVRQVLREQALDLGLLEREDGTFVPASDEPISVDFDGVTGLPDRHLRPLETLLVEEFGPVWHEGQSGDSLRDRIREMKAGYLSGETVDYDRLTALGYAIYHLPAYYATTQYVLAELAADARLPGAIRVVDVGAGVGGPALGLIDLLPADVLVEYHAIEPSAAADVFELLLDDVRPNVHVTVHRQTAESFDLASITGEDDIDLCLFANVLSELDHPAQVARRYYDALDDDGTFVAIEPADRNTAIGLRDVERSLADDGPATVYGPTLRLWPGRRPESECWSFDVKPDVTVPAVQSKLETAASDPDHTAGEFENTDVQYAYSILTSDGNRRLSLTASRDRYVPMSEAEDVVTERIDLLAVKLSHDLATDGNPLYLVGDGSEETDHYAVRAEPSVLNDALQTANYGAVLHFENALLLWNDDEGAYNIVVHAETVVDRVAG